MTPRGADGDGGGGGAGGGDDGGGEPGGGGGGDGDGGGIAGCGGGGGYGDGGGKKGGYGDGGGGTGGGGEGARTMRGPQSWQSVPRLQTPYSEPGPPSSQVPSDPIASEPSHITRIELTLSFHEGHLPLLTDVLGSQVPVPAQDTA